MTEKSKQVETHFHKKYKAFDSFYEEKKGPFARLIDSLFRRSMKLRFEKVIAGVAPYENKTVLDVGCGAGRYSIALALNGIKKSLGVDFAENMIEAAQKRAEVLEVNHICSFRRDDFIKMEVAEPFDHSFAMGVLDYIEDPAAFVKKMAEVSSKSVMVSFPSSGGVVQWFRGHYFRKIKKCPVYFYNEDDVKKIAEKTGHSFNIERLAKDYFLTVTIN